MTKTDALYNRPSLKVAFIGGGINSAVGRAHACALRMDGRYELVAGAFSRSPEINRKSVAFYGVEETRAYPDFFDLIAHEQGRIDAVIVLTPTTNHYQPVITALNAGIPVICEKALASDQEEVAAIRDAETRSRGFLVVTYNYTGYPALRELKALIRTGRLGRILHFTAEMPQEGYLRVDENGKAIKPQDWRLREGEIPVIYLDLGIHLHQIIHYLTGLRPLSVTAVQKSYGYHSVIDYVHASVEYEEGVHGVFYFGKTMLGHRNGLKICIFGDKAAAEWLQTAPEELWLAHNDGRIERIDRGASGLHFTAERYTRFKAGHPAGYIEAFANLYADIATALEEHRATGIWRSEEVFGSDLAMAGMQLLEAMKRSATNRSVILLPAEADASNIKR